MGKTTRTKYMTHLVAYAEGMISLEQQATGLAEELFLGLKELAIEIKGDDSKDLKTEWNKALMDLDNTCKTKLVELTGDKDITLTKYITSFKVRKSELMKGIKAGVDPTKYDSFAAYRKAIDKATNSNASGTNTGKGKGNGSGASTGKGGSEPDNTPKLHSVTNDMSKTAREKLNLAVKKLAQLPEAEQIKALDGFSGKIHQLLGKSGGKFANLKNVANK